MINDIKDGQTPAGTIILAAAVLLVLPAALLFFSSAKLHYPTAQWDGWVLDSIRAIRAGTFSAEPYIIHPPLYLYLLAFFQPLFPGGPLEGARLFNFGCHLLTGWLVFALAAGLAGRRLPRAAGLLAAALYFSSPLAVQGIFLLDLGDTAVVPLAAAAYFCLLVHGAGGVLLGLPLAAAFAVNLWAKLIHPLFIALAAGAELLTGAKGGRSYAEIRLLAAGSVLFLASWCLYSFTSLHQLDRWGPLKYFVEEMLLNYHRQDIQAGAAQLFFTKTIAVARVLLWLWPLLFLWAWRLRVKGFGSGAERCLNYFILLFMAGAWVSKGTSNGFPKYHAAILPGLSALCGAYAAEFLPEFRRAATLKNAALLGAAFLLLYAAGDPLYVLNYAVKKALIGGSGVKGEIGLLLLQLAAVPAVALVLFRSVRPFMNGIAAVTVSLAAAGVIWQAALYLRQARGDYFTTYGYGTAGKAAAVEYLAVKFRSGISSGPNEFAWELKTAGVPFRELSDACMIKLDCALSVLRDKNTSFFVFGQASNTVDQVRYFLSRDSESLGRPFTLVKKGDFWIFDFNAPRR